MSQTLILALIVLYFGVLLLVSYVTSRKADNQTFFAANKSAPWYLVAFGMVGTSLSGVTFISVPGTVSAVGFTYFQVVLGYFIGYFAVAYILLPLYYKMQLTSIYTYLQERFGMVSYKTGAAFFILSRTLGATLRLYLVINVLQLYVLESMGVPFWATSVIILFMILMYTYKGGVKTIVWTDTLQTFFMLLALIVCVVYILNNLNLGFGEAFSMMSDRGFTTLFSGDPMDKKFFLKQILGGAFITITMTGLDQEMMQKNISVKNLGDSQKNMITFSSIMVIVNFLFLMLGGLLYLYAERYQLTLTGDDLFPTVAMQHLPGVISLIFIIGLISALFPSADGAITALTASFCIDILGMQRDANKTEEEKMKLRKRVHLSFAAVFLVFVFYFKWLNDKSIINTLLDIAGYTYGPLLGLFVFGIFSKQKVRDHLTPIACIIPPVLTFLINTTSPYWAGGYKFGLELLIINGAMTAGMLFLFREKQSGIVPVDRVK
ncbi:MAG: sodium:solute symporter [Flavobacteriales bacterium]